MAPLSGAVSPYDFDVMNAFNPMGPPGLSCTTSSSSENEYGTDYFTEAEAEEPQGMPVPWALLTTSTHFEESSGGTDIGQIPVELQNCMTVMVKHVPFKYSQRKLLKVIISAGFLGKFDYMYLPMDAKGNNNRGFAFINFLTTSSVTQFYKVFNKSYIDDPSQTSWTPLEVSPADIQGFENNVEHFVASHAQRRQGKGRPCLLRRLSPRLLEGIIAAGFSTANFEIVPSGIPVEDFSKQPKAAVDFTKQRHGRQPVVQDIITASPEELYCRHCGGLRNSVHLYCPYCGVCLQEEHDDDDATKQLLKKLAQPSSCNGVFTSKFYADLEVIHSGVTVSL
jgi:hypothetical protein